MDRLRDGIREEMATLREDVARAEDLPALKLRVEKLIDLVEQYLCLLASRASSGSSSVL